MKSTYHEWKPKGEYPTDEEGVLFISPYWKKLYNEQKKNAVRKSTWRTFLLCL